MVTWIIMAVLVLLSIVLVRNLKVENPGKKQLALEAFIGFLTSTYPARRRFTNHSEYQQGMSVLLDADKIICSPFRPANGCSYKHDGRLPGFPHKNPGSIIPAK